MGLKRYRWTPEMDAEVKRVYLRKEPCGNKLLAFKFGLPAREISSRAAILGLPPLIASNQHRKVLYWTEKELEIVRAHSGEPTAQIRARLYKQGYSRSLASIRSEVRHLRAAGEAPSREDFLNDQNLMSVPTIRDGLGVAKWIVDDWIQKGWLKTKQAYRGNEHAVHYRDLRQFLIEHVAIWDHRKADRFFLVDVLTNTIAECVSAKKANAA